MQTRQDMDAKGAAILITLFAILAFNQVVIKLTNQGLQPVFAAGLRSAGAVFVLWGWMRLSGQRPDFARATRGAGLLLGTLFAVEFLGLFVALDLTTVSRASVIEPAEETSSPTRMRNSVVLPMPLGPTSPTLPPWGMLPEAPRNTSKSP